MLIKKERVEVYYRNSSQAASSDVLAFFIQTPSTTNPVNQLNEINAAHGTSATTLPPFYAWYNNINAVRFYWRATKSGSTNADTWLANVTISKLSNSAVLGTPSLQLNVQPLAQSNFIKAQWLTPNAKAITLEKSVDGNSFSTIQRKILQTDEKVFSYYDNMLVPISFYKVILETTDGNTTQSSLIKVQSKQNSHGNTKINKTPYGFVIYRSIVPTRIQQLVLYNNNGQEITHFDLGISPIEYISFKSTVKQIVYYQLRDNQTVLSSGKIIL
jgi:hypothetical protein